MPQLVFRIQEPGNPVRELRIRAGMTLGRDPASDCVFTDPNVSGRHAHIIAGSGDGLAIEDLGSSNKTRVAGGPTLSKGESFELLPGARLFLGKTIIDIEAVGVPRADVDEQEATILSPPGRRGAPATEDPTSSEARTDASPRPIPLGVEDISEPPTESKASKAPPLKEPTTEARQTIEEVSEDKRPTKPASKAETSDEPPTQPAENKAPPTKPAVEKTPPPAPPAKAEAKPKPKKALPEIPEIAKGTREPKSFWINRYNVDLSTYFVKHERVQCRDYEDVLGGVARGFKLLEDYEVTDPHSPAAPLILNLGLLSGSQFMTGLRTYFHGYSPLKASQSDSPSAMWTAGSGKFGTKLRYLDVEEVVFTGRAVVPVYLQITPGEDGGPARFQFHNAEPLAGLTANEKIQHLYGTYPEAHFAVIGPAGESYDSVRFAAIALSTINQLRSGDMKSRFCGRGGFGGLMGSKNLLGIVADTPDVDRGDKVDGLKELNMTVARGDGSQRFRDKKKGDGGGGTWANMTALNPLHAMPELNFNPTGTDISVPLYRDSVEEKGDFLVKDEACFACGIACHKNIYEKNEEGKKGPFRAKFDYEPLNLLSSNIGIYDIGQAAELVELVDDLCMDSISCGVTLSYAMEYNRRKKEAGERSLLPDYIEYGNFEGARKTIEEIGRGRLPLLGQGSKRLAEALGQPEYAMHCKGVEFPAYLPHFNPGYPWALAGGHMSMRTYLLYVFEKEAGIDYWVEAITERGPLIMRDDVIGICKFAGMTDDHMTKAIGALSDLAIEEADLRRTVMRTFLRGYKLEKKQGFVRGDYVMPAEIHQANPRIDLTHFNTPEFFAEVQEKVCERLDKMIMTEGI